jgi:hypothetical protein
MYHMLYLNEPVPNIVNALVRARSMVHLYYLPNAKKEPSDTQLKSILCLDLKSSNLSCCSGGKAIVTTSDFNEAITELAAILQLFFGEPLATALWSLYRDLNALSRLFASLTVTDRVEIVARAFSLLLFPYPAQVHLPVWPTADSPLCQSRSAFSATNDDPYIAAVINASVQRALASSIDTAFSTAGQLPATRPRKRGRTETKTSTESQPSDPNHNWKNKTTDVPKPPHIAGRLPCFDWLDNSCSTTDCPRPHQYPHTTTAAVKTALKTWFVANKTRKT